MFNSENPYARWAARILPAFVLWILARLIAPLAVLQMVSTGNRETAPKWAAWAAPFDHTFCGANADPMWIRWWLTNDPKKPGAKDDRAWYVHLLRKLGVRTLEHPLVILAQFLRNGAGTANYRWLGVYLEGPVVVIGEDGQYEARIKLDLPGPLLAFRRTFRWLGGETWIGWKIDAPKDGLVDDGDPKSGYAKWILYPWRK